MENNRNEDRHTSSLGNQSQGSDKTHEQTGTSGTESGARRSGSMDTNPSSHNEMSSGDMGRGSTSSTGSSRMNDDENDSDRTTTTTRSGDDGLESSKGI